MTNRIIQGVTVEDPVCGMMVDPKTTKHRSEYRGQAYFFCSLLCLKAFEDDPERYLKRNRDQRV